MSNFIKFYCSKVGLSVVGVFLSLATNICYSDNDNLNFLRSQDYDKIEFNYNENSSSNFSDQHEKNNYLSAHNLFVSKLKESDMVSLDEWILSGGQNYLPYLLKGMYFSNEGWKARGTSYRNKTPEENIAI